MLLALAAFLAVATLVIDMGVHYQQKASLQILADLAAVQSLASTDPDLTYAEEDTNIRRFVSNLSDANGFSREFFRVKTYACNSDGDPCGYATTDHSHTSTHDTEHIDCSGSSSEHSHDDSHDDSHDEHSSLLPLLAPDGGPMVLSSLSHSRPGAAMLLSGIGSMPVPGLPAWQQPGALNLADAHDGHGNEDTHTGHEGHGMTTTMSTPSSADICRVEVSATVESPSFFGHIFNIQSLSIGVYSAAERNVSVGASVRPTCAFWGRTDVKISGTPFLDSYNTNSGASYTSQKINTDLNGAGYAREMAVGCSDSTFDYNGDINHHGGASAVGQLTINGNSFDIFGDVTTGGPASPTPFTDNVHDTLYPADTHSILKDQSVTALNPPDVDYTEACSLPRVTTYCPKATATANDNSGHITGWYNSSELTSNKKLTNGTGSGSATSCDGTSDRKKICLDAGYTYYFKQLDLSNSCTLVIKGTSTYKTIVYLDAENSCSRTFKIAGQTSFASGAKPADLLLYMGSSTQNLPEACSSGKPAIQITGGGSLYADLYAPGYDMKLTGNGGIYGRAYANTLEIGGTTYFHYDEALGQVGGGSSSSTTKQRVILVE
ncbi:MAG: hypothetical protein HY816_00600 [Candidatus Wallbacteria bacterium]|nr:hypothetical protein [Candidatus Wallbacteria bacterium]